MAKMGCAQCGKAMKKGGVKKMATGGMKTTVGSKTAKTFIAGMPNSGSTGPNYQGINSMKKGGTKKRFPDMSGDGKVTAKDVLMAKGVIKKPKAKFGSSVPVKSNPPVGMRHNPSHTKLVSVATKKKGGPTKSLRKYQGDEGGSEVTTTTPVTTPATTSKGFADYYKANLEAGIKPNKARKIAMVEAGVKTRVDPNAVINAVGNTAGAVGNAINAASSFGRGAGPGFEKRGGAIKKKQYGGTSTSRKLTRLGTKVEKKTAAGKTVGKGLQKRYDKAVDKVIARGLTKAKRGGIKK